MEAFHFGDLFIKEKILLRGKNKLIRKKKDIVFRLSIISKGFSVKFLKHFKVVMLTLCTEYGSGRQLFPAEVRITVFESNKCSQEF